METRRLKLEASGTVHQLKTILTESIKKIEQWEEDRPEESHWWSKSSSGDCYESLNIRKSS